MLLITSQPSAAQAGVVKLIGEAVEGVFKFFDDASRTVKKVKPLSEEGMNELYRALDEVEGQKLVPNNRLSTDKELEELLRMLEEAKAKKVVPEYQPTDVQTKIPDNSPLLKLFTRPLTIRVIYRTAREAVEELRKEAPSEQLLEKHQGDCYGEIDCLIASANYWNSKIEDHDDRLFNEVNIIRLAYDMGTLNRNGVENATTARYSDNPIQEAIFRSHVMRGLVHSNDDEMTKAHLDRIANIILSVSTENRDITLSYATCVDMIIDSFSVLIKETSGLISNVCPMNGVLNSTRSQNNFILLAAATFLASAEKNTPQTLMLGQMAEAALAEVLIGLYEIGIDSKETEDITRIWVYSATLLGSAYANIGHFEHAWVLFSSSYQKVANRFLDDEIMLLGSMAMTAMLQHEIEEAIFLRKLLLFKAYSKGEPSLLVDATTEAALLYHMEHRLIQ